MFLSKNLNKPLCVTSFSFDYIHNIGRPCNFHVNQFVMLLNLGTKALLICTMYERSNYANYYTLLIQDIAKKNFTNY